MNNSTDRDALARRVFDAAICRDNIEPINALGDLLQMIAGIGGYLSYSAPSFDSISSPFGEHLAAIGDMTTVAAKIAAVLADDVEMDLMHLNKLVKANGQGEHGRNAASCHLTGLNLDRENGNGEAA